jgi:hypothetical protein
LAGIFGSSGTGAEATGRYEPVQDRSAADIATIHRDANLLTVAIKFVCRRETSMNYLNFGRQSWAGLAAMTAFLLKRPEVMKGVGSMVVFVGKSYLLQYIQTL